MAGKKLRWGIISTANIGMKKVNPAMMKARNGEVVAIASRDLAKAQAAAAELGIPKAYGSYEAMLADPEIDAVYNPLPNHLHIDLTLAAARAGKHVLCEKPIGMNAEDAIRLREAPKDRIIMEAFMVRFHPQWLRLKAIVQSGELGMVRLVHCIFTYNLTDPTNVRNMADIGGGGILDIGCYPITGARFLWDAEPRRVVALVDRDPVFKTDRLASVIADFGDGRQLSFVCSTQLVGHQKIEAVGDKARAEIVIPFNAPQGQPTALIVDHGYGFDECLARREVIPPSDQYTLQAEAFAEIVFGERPQLYGIENAIQSMRILDAIFESEKTGGWVDVKPA